MFEGAAQNQKIVKTVQEEKALKMIDTPVLGLAGAIDGEIEKLQVRPGDQPGYPKDTIESVLDSSMGLLRVFLEDALW